MSHRAHPRDASTYRPARRSRRLVVAAAAGLVGLLGATEGASAQLPLHDAVAVPAYRYTGDAKDHPRFAARTERPAGRADAKDHPRFSTSTSSERPAARADAKDHPRFGGVTKAASAENHVAMYGEYTAGVRRANAAAVTMNHSVSVARFS